MNDLEQSDLLLVCPFCESKVFATEIKGMLFKNTLYKCQKCNSVIETRDERNFKITSIPEEYSNTSLFMKDRSVKREDLANLGLPIFSDMQLADISSGEGDLFERFLNELPPVTVSVILKSNEKIIAAFDDVKLLEEKSSRRSSGSFSMRITKGLWFNTGSIYKSESSIEEIDNGALVLTNKRYIFIGNKKSIDQSLSKITSIQMLNEGIGVLRSNKTKVEYFSGKYHWALVGSVFMGIVKKFGT